MDLYDAIEIIEELVQQAEDQPKRLIIIAPNAYEIEAIKICLEAARDKAGV